VETYTDQQATPGFRAEFLRTLERLEDIRWWMAPSHGVVHIRLPCPECGWAEKRADRTKLAHLDEDGATFTAVCFDHGGYEAHIDPEDDQPYLDLATLYRNLVNAAGGADQVTAYCASVPHPGATSTPGLRVGQAGSPANASHGRKPTTPPGKPTKPAGTPSTPPGKPTAPPGKPTASPGNGGGNGNGNGPGK